jgi:hypothetical protein
MWTDEEIVQQPAPHTGRKSLLMRSDRRRIRIFMFPHVFVVVIKNPIFCYCGLIGNQHIAGKTGIDGNLVGLPPTKGQGGTTWIVFCGSPDECGLKVGCTQTDDQTHKGSVSGHII